MTTKEKVLEQLTNNQGECVNGEQLAQLCQVSRTAIWKAINSLREEGFEINGTTNGGYVLASGSDIFTKELFIKKFNEKFPEYKNSWKECFKEIDSTNTYAKRVLSDCGSLRDENRQLTAAGEKYHKSVIVAESQTAGRGRSGRSFVSPSKTGIYISVIYAPECGITEPAKITAFSAVAICRGIKKLYGIDASIKWINDIFCNGKKVSGILTEGIANFETGIIEAAIIGIGINIDSNPEAFTGDLSKVAGSILSDGEGKKVNRAEAAAQFAGEVLKVLEENPEDVIAEYKKLSFVIGQEVEVHSLIDSNSGIYKAKAVDIDNKAGLIVELPDGSRKTLTSGEVSLKSISFVK